MKLFRTILVLALLVAFPALSWYYLSKGADWRRTGLSEIETKSRIDIEGLPVYTGDGDLLGLTGSFVIAMDGSVLSDPVLYNKLYEQYDYRDDVILLYIGETEKNVVKGWSVVDCERTNCADLRERIFPGGPNAVLIDDSLNLRRGYDLRDTADLQKLVEHTAILFPVEKRAKINLKRGSDQ